jgi:DNA-binding transcriptional regulator YhcF (GntR family)
MFPAFFIFLLQHRSAQHIMTQFINIQEDSSDPKSVQITNQVIQAVNSGKLSEGDKLPSINQVSKEQKIARDTVFRAYSELKQSHIIDSTPTRGYFVKSSKIKIFLLLDSYSLFKDELYNTFLDALPENYSVDLAFHHYNYNIFETLISSASGKYNTYVIMNFNNKRIDHVLQKIDPEKILILDWGKYAQEKFSYVCQDFGKAPYQCLQQIKKSIKKYHRFHFVYPEDSAHPEITYKYFLRYCEEENINHNKIVDISKKLVFPGDLYWVFRQKDMVVILKYAREKGLKLGKDFGLIAYNDTPLYEVIDKGITTISTDFKKMGQEAAKFSITHNKTQQIIPTRICLRGSI